MDLLNLQLPENKLPLQAGQLLIAAPFLGDPNFSRSVVLICEHGIEGTVGYVLNQATELKLSDLLPEVVLPTAAVFQGGPVQTNTLHFIHGIPAILGGKEIVPGMFWGGSYEALQDLVNGGNYSPSDVRLFVGYSGWSAGQLENELKEGSWIIAETDAAFIFTTPAENVWKKAIGLLGNKYEFLTMLPLNPQLN